MTEAERKEMEKAKRKLMDNALEMCEKKQFNNKVNHKKLEQIKRKEKEC